MDQEENIKLTLFKIIELENSLETIRIKCLEPILINSSNLEEKSELVTFYLFIKESFKTLDILQNLINVKE